MAKQSQKEENKNLAEAEDTLKTLLKMVKSGTFPKEVYDIILKFAGKGNMSENEALQVRTFLKLSSLQTHLYKGVHQKELFSLSLNITFFEIPIMLIITF